MRYVVVEKSFVGRNKIASFQEREISEAEAVLLSGELHKRLIEHQGKYHEIVNRPEPFPGQGELDLLAWRKERDEIAGELEKLSSGLISETIHSWLEKAKLSAAQISVREIGETKWVKGEGHFETHKVLSNRKARANALKSFQDACNDLRRLQHEPLNVILGFIEEQETRFSRLKPLLIEEEEAEISTQTLKDLQGKDEPSNTVVGALTPRGQVFAADGGPQKNDGQILSPQENLDVRIARSKEKMRELGDPALFKK